MALLTFTQELLKLFEQKLDRDIKAFYDGKITEADIPNVDFPLLSIEKLITRLDDKGTGTVRDNVTWAYKITLWIDRKNYLNIANKESEVSNTAQGFLERVVEGLDADLNYGEKTISGILRKNLPVAGKVFYTADVVVSYEDGFENDKYQLAKAEIAFTSFHKVTRLS